MDEAEERGWLPLSPAPLSLLQSSFASLRTISLDDSEHLLHNHHASVASLRLSRWHEQIGDPTIADGILDRLVHNAHRIEMRGESMRKKQNPPQDKKQE